MQDENAIARAKGQSRVGVIGVLSILQAEINKGSTSLIPAKYLNENSLNLIANYLLNGKEIMNSDFTGVDKELKSVADKLLPAVEAARRASEPGAVLPTTKDNTNVIKYINFFKKN